MGRLIDMAARRLAIDPRELRQRNLVGPSISLTAQRRALSRTAPALWKR
jgi:CO/xanthine dehydrogenase Mo-binding subunit